MGLLLYFDCSASLRVISVPKFLNFITCSAVLLHISNLHHNGSLLTVKASVLLTDIFMLFLTV
jgi:hypothetical protein